MPGLTLVVLAAGKLAFAGDAYLAQPHPSVPSTTPLVVNVEGAVCERLSGPRPQDQSRWTLCLSPQVGVWLKQAGVVAAVVENNHRADGAEAKTSQALAAAGVAEVTLERPFCRDGLCVVAWHDGRVDLPRALKVVKRLSARMKVVAVVHHTATVAEDRRALLRRFADAGAAVALSIGSHRVEPIERRGQSVLFHGLGDFAFDCRCSSGTHGLVVEVTADPRAMPVAHLVVAAKQRGEVLGQRAVEEQMMLQLAEASRALGAQVAVVDRQMVVLP